MQRQERRTRREHDREKEEASEGKDADKKTRRESRRSSEGRRRTPISEIFPETQAQAQTQTAGARRRLADVAPSEGHGGENKARRGVDCG